MAGCYQDFRLGVDLLRQNEAVPHQKLSIWIGEQLQVTQLKLDCQAMRANVRSFGYLHHPFARPIRREHYVDCQGALW
jgi:hypothetical protein